MSDSVVNGEGGSVCTKIFGNFFLFIVFVLLKYRNLDSEGLGLDLWIHLLKILLMILLNMELRKYLRKTGLVSRLLPS